ncbi:MAG: hypothetical protein M1821_004360 [Bathelium mastoideum]|nr:MAG: hypothetical protein M1821_004360 [Bathelium mastoideum]
MELKCSKSPLPQVREFDAATVTVDELVDALKVAGGVVVRNMLNKSELDQIEADVRPWLEKDKPWEGSMFPPETRRAFSMIGKSKTFALRIVGHPLWLGVTDALLTSTLKWNWVGEKNEVSVSGPQLNNTIVFSISPGARNQALHRDDVIHHPDHRAVAEHELSRDAGIGLFVGGKRTTKKNGATRFIPGSHLWDYSEGPPREDQTFYAELEPGDGFMMLSGCFHGGSANTTENEERLVYSTFSTRGWMRQEENQYLANDIEKIRELPEWLQERVGYGLSRPFLGWIDLKNPMLILHPDKEKYGDMW